MGPLQELHGWHARSKCDYMHCVGSKLKRCEHENLHGCPGILYYQGDFYSNSRKVERFHRKSAPSIPACMHLSHLQISLTLFIHTFWVIKGKEKMLIIFLYISVVVFLCYTTISLHWHYSDLEW